MPKERKHFTPEEKVSILRRHLLDKVPVSTICEEAGIHPSLLYQWQKQFFENGAAAFQPSARPKPDQAQQRIGFLEQKLRRKDEVLAELMEEHVALKKSLGEF
jgi:transposase-like protein